MSSTSKNFLSPAPDDESRRHAPDMRRRLAQASAAYCAGGGPGNCTTAVTTALPGGT